MKDIVLDKDLVEIIIIDEIFPYGDINVLGFPLKEHLIKSLTHLKPKIINDISQITIPNGKYTIVLYTYMPLITQRTIKDLVLHCEKTGIRAMRIGKGWICRSELLSQDISAESTYKCGECMTALSPQSLTEIYNQLRLRVIDRLIDKGVLMLDKTAVYIDYDAEVEEGAIIYPMVTIKGKSVIKNGATIRSGSVIENSIVESGVNVLASFVYDSKIGDNTTVGPYSLIRCNSLIGSNVRIGDFVEIKASTLGDGVKAAHLAYIGDAEVGENTNIGCGTVFVNYNGKIKQKTVVGKNAFIGSNTNLIAPIKVGDCAFTAAGSTVTEDVPEGNLCIARARQVNKERKDK